MAVKDIKEAGKKKKRRYITDYFWIAVVAFFVVGLITSVISDARHTSDINSQLAAVNAEITEVENQNDEIREILEGGDYLGYIEKIARENYGYCSPGEDVYYNNLYGE